MLSHRPSLLIACIFAMLICPHMTGAQEKVQLIMTPITDQATPTRPMVLGQNMTAIDWHGIRERTQPAYYNPQLGKIDPSWLPLLNAFDMHQLRWHWGNTYSWKDSVGPQEQRKSIRHDLWNAWFKTQAGLDEFLTSFQSLPNPPQISLIASPLRPVDELADLVAYCNATEGPMAKWRAANGHPAPYNIKRWEMGNEVDYRNRADLDVMRQDTKKEKENKVTVEQYIPLIRQRIKAMKQVDPTIEIYVHAKTAPWFINNPDWPLWHQTLLKEMGTEIDGIVIHPYYDGYTVQTCLKSIDQLINDIKQLGPKDRQITVWVNEHARWVNYKKIEERPQSWSIQGAISSADFLIELMKRPQVTMANYWCYGHRGPWRVVINDSKAKGTPDKFGTAIHGMFRIFNQALLPVAIPVQVDELNIASHPPHYTYNASAMLFTDPATGKTSLLAINRSDTDSFETSITLPKLNSSQATQWILTGDSLRSTNVPQTPFANTVSQKVIQTQQDADGKVKLTLPVRSVVAWRWD
ncbi:MAG TPA: alpha-L-arabinofuranosidase [Phycisphaerales bacterium]|nr:alpha-L-arabinofuranosidase [Phycisphaerales bacterium]HCD32086.1 alpha-L-arabinofuranosidase [Phycisphaerales bacterium]|tara:strand:- start:20 stop:1588 length:1569 start_codon:yes stop_codon:yes gene_type:complete